jgi:sodium-coupled neutral amino acid transporter 11
VRQVSETKYLFYETLPLDNSDSAEFELDSDELGDTSELRHTREYNDQTMPLLIGLMDTATARRSMDVSLPLHGNGEIGPRASVDLEDLAAKRIEGGGMIDSVANMANSILGAGSSIPFH